MNHDKLEDSESRYRQLVELSPDANYTATEGKITYINPAGVKLLGAASQEELLGFAVMDLIHPDFKEIVAERIRHLRDEKTPVSQIEEKYLRLDGAVVDVEVSAAPFLDQGRAATQVIVRDITERKRAEEALTVREQAYRTLLENIPDLIVRYDTELRRIYVNPAWEKASGLSAADVINKCAADITIVPKPVVIEYEEKLRQVLETGSPQTMDFTWVNARGEELFLEYTIVPEYDRQGKIISVLAVGRDQTERKRAEEERLAHLHFFEKLDRVNQALQGSTDLEQMMSEVMDAVLAIFGCDRAWLFYPCDPEAPTWHVPMERTRPEYPGAYALGGEYPMTQETAEVLRTIRDASGVVKFGPGAELPLEPELAQRFSYQSQIAMALYPKGDKPYVFGLHQCSYPRVWTPEEERLLQEVGRRLTDALTSLLIYRDLQKSEEKYRLLVKQIPAVVFKGYSDGSVDFFDDKIEALTGYSKEDFCARRLKWPDLIIPTDQQGARERFIEALKTNHSYMREYRILKKSGEIGWIQAMGQIFLDAAGQIDFISGVFFEITARKVAEEALAAERQKFFSLLEAMPAYLGLMTPDYRVVFANLYFRKQFGEPAGRRCYDYMFGRSEPCENCQAFKVLETKKEEYEWVGPDGRVYQICDQLVHDADGSPLILEMGIDITKRKQVEEALRRSEWRKAILNRISMIFLTIPDEEMYAEVLNVVLEVTESKFGVFGFIADNGDLVMPSMTREVWGECLVPDKSVVFPMDRWGHSLWGKAIRERKAYSSDGPFQTPEGHIHIDNFLAAPIVFGKKTIGLLSVANRATGYTNEDKELMEVITNFVSPILNARQERDRQEHQRKLAKEALRQASLYSRSLIEASLDPLVTISPDGKIMDVNQATEVVTGISREELIHQDFSNYFTEPEKAREGYQQAFFQGMVRDYPLAIRHVSGRATDVLYNASTYANEAGEVQGVFAAARDITERKRAEQKAAQLAAIVQSSDDAIFGKTLDGIITSWNTGAERIYGYQESEMIGKPISILVPPGFEAEVPQILVKIKSGEHVEHYESVRRRKDGHLIDMSLTVSPIRDMAGKIVAVSTIGRDITARKRAEDEIRNAAQKWRTTFDAMRDGICLLDQDGRMMQCNQAMADLLGKPEIIGRPCREMVCGTSMPIEDCLLHRTKESRHRETKTLEKGERWWYITIDPILNEVGEVTGGVYTIADITERKHAQDKIENLTILFKAIKEINEAFLRIKSEKELFQHTCNLLLNVPYICFNWIGLVKPDDFEIIPVAWAGAEDGYLSIIKVTWDDSEYGRGPTGEAIRTGRPVVRKNLDSAPYLHPWKEEALKRGYLSSITLPLIHEGEVIGILKGYAGVPDAFGETEINFLEQVAADIAVGIRSLRLEQELIASLIKMEVRMLQTVEAIAAMAELRDPYTAGHQRGVTQLACALAREMGLSDVRIEGIRVAGFLHDIGKIVVPAEILSKPGKLSEYEMNIIRTHPQAGYDILKKIDFPWPVAQIVLQHHERLNGSGYLQSLQGPDILQEAKILAVADVVEAMAAHRPYRPALGIEVALEEVTKNKGILYDSEVVDMCIRLFKEKGFILD